MTPSELNARLAEAKHRVRILGVVGLDAAWEEILPAWAALAQAGSNFRADILCESDNMLFGKAFTSDIPTSTPRLTFQDLKFVRDRALEIPALLGGSGASSSAAIDVSVEIIHL